MRRILYVVLDGLGDEPHPALGGRTPLEAAATPNLDLLARRGSTGLVHTVGKGIAPESDVGVIAILGYRPEEYYTGRGPLEAHAVGVKVRPGDLAYRVNFATLGDGRRILDRRVGRTLSSGEAAGLAAEIRQRVALDSFPATFDFVPTVGHRGVLVFHPLQGALSAAVTNTDPAYGREGTLGVARAKFEEVVLDCEPLPEARGSQESRRAALLTNEFLTKSRAVLEASPVNAARRARGELPANGILTRDAGDRLPEFPPLAERFGVRFACLVEMPVERGIALLTGMEIVELGPLSGEGHRDYPVIVQAIRGALPRYGGLYVHVKGPDLPAHDGDPLRKRDVIEEIDQYLFGPLCAGDDLDGMVVAVTADHATSCLLKAHSAHPVPLLVVGGDGEGDGSRAFSERECARGRLGTLRGEEIMPLLIRRAGART